MDGRINPKTRDEEKHELSLPPHNHFKVWGY